MARKVLGNLDLNNNQLLNALAHIIAGDPGSPQAGQFWYNSSTGLFKWRNASATIDPLARANHSGSQLAATISDFDTQVRTSTLNQMTAPTADLSINTHKLTGVVDPTGAQDAATKNYVDLAVQGIKWKASVRAATTAAGTLGTSFENGDTIDGVVLATGDRILIKDQAAGAENGIYTVNASGAPTRATDADTAAEILQAAVFVQEGTVNADTGWTLATNAPITLGTTALTFTQFTGVGPLVAGAGLTKTGSTVDVIAGATKGSAGPGGGLKVNADDVVVDFDVAVGKFSADIGDGSTTSIVVTHNLGTKDVIVTVYDKTTPFSEFTVEVQHTSTATITLVFAVAPTTAQYRVVVHA